MSATTATPTRRRRRLKSIENVRSFVADVLRRIDSSELPSERGRVLLYGCQILAGVVQGSDLEARLAALERGSETSVRRLS